MARRPLEREQVYLNGGRRTTQLMRDSLGSIAMDYFDPSQPANSDAYADVRDAVAKVCPEVASGIVQVRAIGRVPGTRTKIAVSSSRPDIDAIGSCVGLRGERVQAIVRSLGGEAVDLIPWVEDPSRFIKFALAPIPIVRMDLFPLERRAVVVAHRQPRVVHIGSLESIWITASQVTGWRLEFVPSDAA